ncbi:tetratricopeptide repeat protein [Sphingomonas sp. ID0503]|uniref:tetratricopeptide repeat protein n=1 Tax=Sphingomonas sp. ID0503 TaxID=3399691 RepID=UPI003AFA8DF4
MRPVIKMIAAAALVTGAGCGNAQTTTLIPSLERLSKSGNAEAIYQLGMAYQTGSGVTEDHAKALDAFRKAAGLGDPLGSYKLGCYYDGQGDGVIESDAALALKYKLVAAEAGYALAQHDVGVLYAQSGDVPTGLAWLEKSAAQGWSGGLMTLASVYNGAAGVKPDAAKTAAYFQLFLVRSEPNDKQTAWLKDFVEHLSNGDKRRAAKIVRSYRPVPTELTLKALSGQRAAQALVESTAGK